VSKLETPITRWYWSQIGGTLVEEFPLTPRTKSSSGRWVDGGEGRARVERVGLEQDGVDALDFFGVACRCVVLL
jgi:hypothetical protein